MERTGKALVGPPATLRAELVAAPPPSIIHANLLPVVAVATGEFGTPDRRCPEKSTGQLPNTVAKLGEIEVKWA